MTIAEVVRSVKWQERESKAPKLTGLPDFRACNLNWPMRDVLQDLTQPYSFDKLTSMRDTEKQRDPRIALANHILGVVASVNELILGKFNLLGTGQDQFDNDVKNALGELQKFCLRRMTQKQNENTTIQSSIAEEFASSFLRVAALYHDVGKIIGNDRHVSRGVHLMRDVRDQDRSAFEDMIDGAFTDKNNFWALLSLHDIFGCLCTGEASLPALTQVVSWSGDSSLSEPHKSPAALISYLTVLNMADSDSSLCFNRDTELTGLRTLEANRYLEDWRSVKALLWDDGPMRRQKDVSREGFKESLLKVASHPEETIKRIMRLITTSYRMCIAEDLLMDELQVSKMVEDELQMLHGARLQMFCYVLARFCKIDYGLRFFNVVLQLSLLDEKHGLLERADGGAAYTPPNKKAIVPARDLMSKDEQTKIEKSKEDCPWQDDKSLSDDANATGRAEWAATRSGWLKGAASHASWSERRGLCLRDATHHICSILKRIADDYGYLVLGDPLATPLLCIVMAGLMPESESKTAWAICRALKEHDARALAWISQEVSVSLYGD